jgi:hypothetical protein
VWERETGRERERGRERETLKIVEIFEGYEGQRVRVRELERESVCE